MMQKCIWKTNIKQKYRFLQLLKKIDEQITGQETEEAKRIIQETLMWAVWTTQFFNTPRCCGTRGIDCPRAWQITQGRPRAWWSGFWRLLRYYRNLLKGSFPEHVFCLCFPFLFPQFYSLFCFLYTN